MRLEIEHHTFKDPNLILPIKLENLSVFRNKHDQWCVYFRTKNHKYLRVDYNISGSVVNGNRLENGLIAHGFTVETFDEFRDEESRYDYPCDSLVIWLVPENKKESDEISGVGAIFPMKWCYSMCVLNFDDFYEKQN